MRISAWSSDVCSSDLVTAMKTPILRRAIVAGVLATSSVIGITAATPAYAQFGGIVYDPTNYAQNVLTAARSLQQINNQITKIHNQATSPTNTARNNQKTHTEETRVEEHEKNDE